MFVIKTVRPQSVYMWWFSVAFCQVWHFSYAHLSKRKVPLNLVIGGSLFQKRFDDKECPTNSTDTSFTDISSQTSNHIFDQMIVMFQGYNPGQNYLRKFSPSCPLSYATKLFPKRRLCGKKTPSPNPMLLPTNAQGSGFLLNTQQHCFQGKGEREEPVQVRCLEKCCPSIQFS